MTTKRASFFSLALVLALAAPLASRAATITWGKIAGGDYTNANNWVGGVVPGAADTIKFASNAAYTVNFTSNQTVSVANFTATTGGTVFMNFGTNTLTVASAFGFDMGMGSGQTNTLILNNGTLSLTNSGTEVRIGQSPNSLSTVIISNATFNSAKDLWIGGANGNPAGNGNLIIYNGTNIEAGALQVGANGGIGNVLLTAPNALLVSTNLAFIGSQGGATPSIGTVTISNGMFVAVGGLSLGYNTNSASGALNIFGGTARLKGNLTTGGGSANHAGSGSILVSGTNALLVATNGFSLGQFGGVGTLPSTLTISNGTVLMGGGGVTVYVGSGASTKGVITMTGGTNSLVSATDRLYVGNGAGSTGEIWLVGNNNPVFNAQDYNTFGVAAGSVGRLVVSNGMFTSSGRWYVGNFAGAVGQITVAGGTIRMGGSAGFNVGTVPGSTGTVYVGSGGVLDVGGNAVTIGAGNQNAITNVGGTYQFSAAPSAIAITRGQVGQMILTNGILSFRAINNASPILGGTQLTNITYQGNNSFQLNAATNATGLASYTFDSVANTSSPTNFQQLILTGVNPLWRSAALTIDSGGALLVTNAADAAVAGVTTNSGAITIADSGVTWLSNVVLSAGSYTSRSSTNTFSGGLLVKSGANFNIDAFSKVAGAVTNDGAMSILNGSIFNPSNGNVSVGSGVLQVNSGGTLNLSNGSFTVGNTVSNSGTINVVNSLATYKAPVVIGGGYLSDPSTNVFNSNVTVTASGYLSGSTGDLFQFECNLTIQSTNSALYNLVAAGVLFTNGSDQHVLNLTNSFAFDYGTNFSGIAAVLSNFAIGTLTLSSGDTLRLTGGTTNALYVGVFDIGGLANTNNLTLDINLYYDMNLAANGYLGSNTFNFGGAGYLTPYPGGLAIPEPSPLLAVGTGLALLAFLRRRKA